MPSSPAALQPACALRSFRTVLVLVGVSALSAACSTAPSDRPLDVGSMAYPQPLPEGNFNTTAISGAQPFDTGSMAFPEPMVAGTVGRATASWQERDTGSMAYPAPLAVGNLPVTRVR